MPVDKIGKKKLKQSRLPFSPIDPKTQKKRKLSSDFGNQSSKAIRTEAVSSEKVECTSPKHYDDIEIIEDSKHDTVIEEKENLKSKSTEQVIPKADALIEDSNDGIEILEIIEKSDSPESTSESSSVKKQKSKKVETVNKSKRKRKSSPKPSPSNIKKFFKDAEKGQKAPRKFENTEKKSEHEMEVCTSDKPDVLNQSSKESGLNESSESNCTDSVNDSSTHSTGEERTEEDKDVSAPKTPSQKNTSEEKTKEDKGVSAPTTPSQSSTCKEKTKEGKSVSSPKTPSQSSSLRKKNITPKQKILEMKMKKQEERLQFKLQKEQEKKEKELEKQKLKEERQRKKNEELEVKEKEKEEKRLKREEEKQKREEKKEEERLKKEEERLKKEEEKQKKEEEKLLAEEEEREKQKKLKAKFAQFFVPKKVDSKELKPNESENSSSDNFIHFRVKENMKIAPLVRRFLSQEEREMLEDYFQNPQKEVNYLQEIKKNSYVKGKSFQTFPPMDDKFEEEEICEIISDDDEEIDGTDILELKSCQTKKFRAKFLKFCENSRPAYYGTWSKKAAHLNGRKPFRKEEIFDYEYDSDEDWEDVENGESLSDSDGEGDDGGKEDSNQYEVDNEFFVPHGYLSDGECEEENNEEEEMETENEEKKEQNENVQKERLKQKQEEFELEMKQKTKQLKPKVYGCVWLGDRSSHLAYDQLMKILMPHKATVLFGTCPITLGGKETNNQELKENDDDEGHEDDSVKKFVKNFPEKAVPELIRLIHGNRHSKLFLIREFSEYWKKKQEETDADSGFIAMRKIEPKIQEIGQYGRFSENGVSLKYRTWYVAKEIREKYGLEDLSLNNRWQYTLPVKEWKHESKEEKSDEPEDSTVSKQNVKSPFIGTNLITKFTKVLNGEEEKKKLFNITSNNTVQSPCSTDATTPPTSSDNPETPDNSGATNNLTITPTTGKKGRKRVSLVSVIKEKGENSKPKNSIVAMFKNIVKEKTIEGKKSSSADKEEQLECITLE